ncbi:MAG: hypothetical protein HGB11_06545 [Chlorobiales bacterium]|nr:hypothetical protein [Chlorobiales bacterium]
MQRFAMVDQVFSIFFGRFRHRVLNIVIHPKKTTKHPKSAVVYISKAPIRLVSFQSVSGAFGFIMNAVTSAQATFLSPIFPKSILSLQNDTQNYLSLSPSIEKWV